MAPKLSRKVPTMQGKMPPLVMESVRSLRQKVPIDGMPAIPGGERHDDEECDSVDESRQAEQAEDSHLRQAT